MKRSRTFHQTSTPLSESCVEPSPPSFKRLSVIQPICKEAVSKRSKKLIKRRNKSSSTKDRKLANSSLASSIDVSESGVYDSNQEAGSFSSVLSSKVVRTKTAGTHSGFSESTTKERRRVSDSIQIGSHYFQRETSVHYSTEKNDFSFRTLSFDRDIRPEGFLGSETNVVGSELGTEKNTLGGDELSNSKKKIVSTGDIYKRIKKVYKSRITKHSDAHNVKDTIGFKIDEKDSNDLSSGDTAKGNLVPTNELEEITPCDVLSDNLNELTQKPPATLIRRQGEKLQKKFKKSNKLINSTSNKLLPKCFDGNKNAVHVGGQMKRTRKNRRQDLSTNDNVKTSSECTTKNNKIPVENGILDFIKKFHAGLDFHGKQLMKSNSNINTQTKGVLKPDIANTVSSKSLYERPANNIEVIQSASKNASFQQPELITMDLLSGSAELYNQTKEKDINQIDCLKQFSFKEQDSRMISDEVLDRNVLTVGDIAEINSPINHDIPVIRNKSVPKDVFNQSTIIRRPTQNVYKIRNYARKPERKSKDPLSSTKSLLDGTFSYPSTSTPFDSPEVQTKRMPSIVRDLSPVIEEQPKIDYNSLYDIEPSLIYANRTYGKQSRSNTTLSKEDRLWFSMTKSLSGTKSAYTTALSKTSISVQENSKDISETKKDSEEISLFESPLKELSSEVSGKDEIKKPTKRRFLKKKSASKAVIETKKRKKSVKATNVKNVESSEDWNKIAQLSEHFEDISNWSLCIEQIPQ